MPMTVAGGSVAGLVRRLPPACFSFVMANGIVSTAFDLAGWTVLSIVLLVIAALGLVVLLAGSLWRVIAFRDAVRADAHNPAKAFGFLTVVAGINVLGVRMYPYSPTVTMVLAAMSVPLWLLLVYGVPATLILHRGDGTGPVATQVNGSWFLWVVATQSVATEAAVIGRGTNNEHLFAGIAVAMWSVGVMLYVMLATLVTLRLLTTRNEAISLGPAYWIYMGATAITVLAGSRILTLSPDLPVMQTTRGVVAGLTFVLWAFGVWWVPLLLIFGVWRHVSRRLPLRYEIELWSIVFPLGMYSVASIHFGDQNDLDLVSVLGHGCVWLAGIAWLLTTVGMVSNWVRRNPPAASPTPGTEDDVTAERP